MEKYFAGEFDIAVVGAGHAGIEASLAASRMGARVVCFTINLDAVGNLPCNPSIGGTAKGHLVREIDALGGEMARAADECSIQFRMLNRGKGPAVHSLRAQTDRRAYQERMKLTLERAERLCIRQAEAVEILTENGRVSGVMTRSGACFSASCVIVCSGTYLGGRVITGGVSYESGPDGMFPARFLTGSLLNLGVATLRFKTGTPPRVKRGSVDISRMEPQPGDDDIRPFSFETNPASLKNTALCYLTYTNEKTHAVIRENLHRSPLYSGVIEGVGPRYCPSIEDKVVRFPDRERHQIFIEPMGSRTDEMYVQGLSSSLPEDVQLRVLHTIPGLERAEVTRFGYAIEYDCADPLQLRHTLEFKDIPGLFGAGQFCGTSGYEEAAAQGLVAGINAALKIKGAPELVLSRSDGYIGALIDDLVTKGTAEPYRMMTSRSEYRLLLRQDNADIRLCGFGREAGLITGERFDRVKRKYDDVGSEIARISKVFVRPSEALDRLLASSKTSPCVQGAALIELIRRPQLSYEVCAALDPERPCLPREVAEQVDILIKYEGYIKRQMRHAEQMHRMEARPLPDGIDYASLHGLRTEARQKLSRIRPESLGQASRISGVNPADIAALIIHLEARGRGNEKNA